MSADATLDLNDTTPAAPANGINVKWQSTGTDPRHVSAALVGPGGTSTFLRADGTWQTPAGSGSIPTGSNVVLAAPRTATDSTYSGFSVIKKLAAGQLVNLAGSWKFSFSFVAGVNYTCNAVVYRTLIDSTTIVDSTTVKWSSSSTVNFTTAGETFSDSVAIALDTAHDYYIVVYFQSGTGTINIWTSSTVLPGEVNTGFVSGDKTGLGGGGTVPTISNAEETIYRVIST